MRMSPVGTQYEPRYPQTPNIGFAGNYESLPPFPEHQRNMRIRDFIRGPSTLGRVEYQRRILYPADPDWQIVYD